MSDVLHRQWQMLRLLPRAPRKIDGARIEALLAETGFGCQPERMSTPRPSRQPSPSALNLPAGRAMSITAPVSSPVP